MLEVFLSALGAVATLFVFVAGGFLFARKGMVRPDFPGQLSGVVFRFFLPLLMLKILLLQTDVNTLGQSASLLIVATAVILSGIPIGMGISRLLKGRMPQQAAQFAAMFPNYVFMGMPVILAMYGDAASQPLVIYSLPHSLLVSTLGYMVLASSGKVNWRSVINPCTISVLVGFAWLALGIPVPGFVADVLEMGSNVVSPIAMFQVGMIIGGFRFDGVRVLRDAALFSVARLIVLPLIVAVVLTLCGLRGLYVSVPAMVTAMPVAANMTITAGAVGRHEQIAAQTVFVTTVLSLITIPVMAVIVEFILQAAM